MLSNGYVPEAVGFGLTAPLINDKVENYATTLTPVIYKLFVSVILQLTENKLQTDNVQFSFKKAMAVQMLFLPLKMLTIFHSVVSLLAMQGAVLTMAIPSLRPSVCYMLLPSPDE